MDIKKPLALLIPGLDGTGMLYCRQLEALSKKYVRIIVKKFLHKHDLTEAFKVIGDAEALKVKERKIEEEED